MSKSGDSQESSKLVRKELPEPTCPSGYTDDDLKNLLGDRIKEFQKWMIGQTIGSCDGRAYNHEVGEYVNTGCGPHGYVTYYHDVKRFLDGKPVID